MLRKIRAIAILAVLIAVIAPPAQPLRAADPPHLSTLTIRLWPEFDKPGVLVFLVGQTAGDTPLPATVTFTLPPGATVNAVAYLDTSRGVLTDQVPHTIDGQTVSITTPNGNFHIEFYDPALKIDNGTRSYTIQWQQPMSVDQLTWQIEQPAGASTFTIEPDQWTLGSDENGLPSYALDGGAVAPGVASTVTLTYTKTDDRLTSDILSAATQPAPAPEQKPDNPTNMIIIGLVLALAVVVSALMYFRSVQGAQAAQPARVPPSGAGGASKKSAKRFCPQCGQPAKPADQFCRKCGTKLRK